MRPERKLGARWHKQIPAKPNNNEIGIRRTKFNQSRNVFVCYIH